MRSTKVNLMPAQSDQHTFSLRISRRAKNTFESLHAKTGFKNRNLTFEALVLSSSVKDIIDPRDIALIKVKLDYLIELLQAP